MYLKAQLIQEIGNPQGFREDISNCLVFRLSGGERDDVLLLLGPANWIVTTEQDVTIGRNMNSNVPTLIGIKIYTQIEVIDRSPM